MMSKSRRSAEEKIRIVMESLETSISLAELCHKHSITPTTFYKWKSRFIDGGRAALAASKDSTVAMQEENECFKRLIGELTIANDAFKKTLEGRRGQ